MTKVVTLKEIKKLVDIPTLISEIESGFALYSEGRTEVPPVGFLHLDQPPGDVHIKYGFIKGDNYYVLKVASAFYENRALNLPVNDGVVMVFSAQTGGIEYVLLDEGWLTDIRTAAAGAVAAKHLAPRKVDKIGIVGTGVQARLQLELLSEVVDCNQCLVWGRDPAKVKDMIGDLRRSDRMRQWGVGINAVTALADLVSQSGIIVTTTSAREPLIAAEHVQPGTHITAIGSDDHGKQELASGLLARADIVAADSIVQCVDHGECHAAVRDGHIEPGAIIELGTIIKKPSVGRADEKQITIADLTGVAVQDIQVATIIAASYNK